MPANHPHQPGGRGHREIQIAFDPNDLRPVTPYSADLKDEYEEAKHALEELRQREELIRRKAEQLEEITQKEEAFTDGRAELLARLEEYMEMLDREALEARQLAQDCASTHQRLHHHFCLLQKLHPHSTDRAAFKLELDHALEQIHAAEDEVLEAQPLIDHLSGKKKNRGSAPARPTKRPKERGNEFDFLYWLKAGVTFGIPILVITIVIVGILYFMR